MIASLVSLSTQRLYVHMKKPDYVNGVTGGYRRHTAPECPSLHAFSPFSLILSPVFRLTVGPLMREMEARQRRVGDIDDQGPT